MMRNPLQWMIPATLLALLLSAPLRAEDPPAAAAPAPAATPDPAAVTRAELAASLLRFDLAVISHPPAPDQSAEVSKRFDAASMLFFSGKNAESIRSINDVTAGLDPAKPRTPALDLISSLKLVHSERIGPFVDWAFALYPRLVSMYPVALPGEGKVEFVLRARAEDGTIPHLMEKPFSVQAGPEVRVDETFTMFADSLPIGAYDVEVALAGGTEAMKLGRWYVVPRKLEEVRKENETKLAAIQAGAPALLNALAVCKARNTLLTHKPSETNSAQFLSNPNVLAKDLDAEIAALAEGSNPYRRRVGDYWRILPASPKAIPMRLYAPEAAVSGEPVPVVIALHGAGGDENMFMDAYGAGFIRSSLTSTASSSPLPRPRPSPAPPRPWAPSSKRSAPSTPLMNPASMSSDTPWAAARRPASPRNTPTSSPPPAPPRPRACAHPPRSPASPTLTRAPTVPTPTPAQILAHTPSRLASFNPLSKSHASPALTTVSHLVLQSPLSNTTATAPIPRLRRLRPQM